MSAPDAPARVFARKENRKMTDFLRGADVLIMDTQYDADEYKRHTGWGHGCLDDVVTLALQAQVKTLFLFHHDPSHDDAKVSQMLAELHGSFDPYFKDPATAFDIASRESGTFADPGPGVELIDA